MPFLHRILPRPSKVCRGGHFAQSSRRVRYSLFEQTPRRAGLMIPQLCRLSFEFVSISLFVSRTSPRICVHSETMFPTTCPHFELASNSPNKITHPIPVTSRKIVNECARIAAHSGRKRVFGSCLLCAEPFSYKCFVANTITTRPNQSATAFPKKDPTCVCGSERLYNTIHKIRMHPAVRLSACRRANELFFLVPMANSRKLSSPSLILRQFLQAADCFPTPPPLATEVPQSAVREHSERCYRSNIYRQSSSLRTIDAKTNHRYNLRHLFEVFRG